MLQKKRVVKLIDSDGEEISDSDDEPEPVAPQPCVKCKNVHYDGAAPVAMPCGCKWHVACCTMRIQLEKCLRCTECNRVWDHTQLPAELREFVVKTWIAVGNRGREITWTVQDHRWLRLRYRELDQYAFYDEVDPDLDVDFGGNPNVGDGCYTCCEFRHPTTMSPCQPIPGDPRDTEPESQRCDTLPAI